MEIFLAVVLLLAWLKVQDVLFGEKTRDNASTTVADKLGSLMRFRLVRRINKATQETPDPQPSGEVLMFGTVKGRIIKLRQVGNDVHRVIVDAAGHEVSLKPFHGTLRDAVDVETKRDIRIAKRLSEGFRRYDPLGGGLTTRVPSLSPLSCNIVRQLDV